MGIRNTIFINDIAHDLAYIPHLEIARRAGFRAVKSVPIISGTRQCLGVISTHFACPKSSWDTPGLLELMPELVAAAEEYRHHHTS